MSEGPPASINAQQEAFWNEDAGPRWVRYQRLLDVLVGDIGQAAIDAAAPTPGERVLDVGCGCGATCIELSRRVGREGVVIGVDISRPMLARAQQRLREEAELDNVALRLADAQSQSFARAHFDLVFSRFGLMFFSDPPAAFANLCGALRPGGRLATCCWQARERNPWARVAAEALAAHVELPPVPQPGEPGPWALADADRFRALLGGAGFSDVRVESLEPMISFGGPIPLEEAVELAVRVGPASAAFAKVPEAEQPAALASVRAALAPHHGTGGVRLPGAAWIVTARR